MGKYLDMLKSMAKKPSNVLEFPGRTKWERAKSPPLLTDRVDSYPADLDACIEAQRKAMSALARMTRYDDERFADLFAFAADAHNQLKKIRSNHV